VRECGTLRHPAGMICALAGLYPRGELGRYLREWRRVGPQERHLQVQQQRYERVQLGLVLRVEHATEGDL
jgi:hypothetical protein